MVVETNGKELIIKISIKELCNSVQYGTHMQSEPVGRITDQVGFVADLAEALTDNSMGNSILDQAFDKAAIEAIEGGSAYAEFADDEINVDWVCPDCDKDNLSGISYACEQVCDGCGGVSVVDRNGGADWQGYWSDEFVD